MKTRFLLGFMVVVGCIAVWLVNAGRHGLTQQSTRQVAPAGDAAQALQPLPGDTVVQAGPSTTMVEPAPAEVAVTPPVPSVGQDSAGPPAVSPAPAPAPVRRVEPARVAAAPEPLVPKPIARAALGSVGADPDAEEVWVNAINDPNRSANERKDLIEDLNEDGFPDPKNITEDDLPLIVSRLALIEELAPDAVDDVNLAAFQEAYKDLVNMLDRLSRK
jgi:hypothetical protein